MKVTNRSENKPHGKTYEYNQPSTLPGQVAGQGVLPLVWPSKPEHEERDRREAREEHEHDNRMEWYE